MVRTRRWSVVAAVTAALALGGVACSDDDGTGDDGNPPQAPGAPASGAPGAWGGLPSSPVPSSSEQATPPSARAAVTAATTLHRLVRTMVAPSHAAQDLTPRVHPPAQWDR